MDVKPDPNGLDQLFVTADEFGAEFEVFGACPVQGTGTVRGRDLYFRARHGKWSFEVADKEGNLPSDGCASRDGFILFGDDPHHGYMPLPEAVAIIERCLREFQSLNSD
jgi:hypothetical protein